MLEMKYYNDEKAIGVVGYIGLLVPVRSGPDNKNLMGLALHHFNAYEKMADYLKEWNKTYLLPYVAITTPKRVPENVITELLALADISPEPLKVGDTVKVIDVPLGAKVEIIRHDETALLNSNTLCKILELPKP